MSILQRFSVLRRLHRGEEFNSLDEVQEFEQRLGMLVKKGVVEVVPVGKHFSSMDEEAWFRDPRTGAVFRYVKPDFPSRGHWGPVDKPEEPSIFESLCQDSSPSDSQYQALVRSLDEAWQRGEIECGLPREFFGIANVYFFHRLTEEIFRLQIPDLTKRKDWLTSSWMKIFGSWPGKYLLGPPPWRTQPDSILAKLSPMYPSPEEYRSLLQSLDDLWQKNLVLCGKLPDQKQKDREKALFHHPATDETFQLTGPAPAVANNAEAFQALWVPTPRTRALHAWPGDLVLGLPPWRETDRKSRSRNHGVP